MLFFRRLYRIVAIITWMLLLSLWSVPYRFQGWKGRRKVNYLVHLWCRGVAKIINLRIKTHGDARNIPAGLIVSNHLGFVDIITHGAIFTLRYTSTVEIAKWPVIGQIVSLSDPVLVDRDSRSSSKKALRDFAKTVRRGFYLIVYPEGTSTDGKSGILPFKSTSFEAATAGNIPVIPILTRYREVPGRPTVCWYGEMEFFPHLWKVLGLPTIDAELYFLPPVYPSGRSRKEMAAHVHGIMEREYRSLKT